MSTRGVYGFRLDGEDKLSYNHSSSYPEYLGHEIFDDVKSLLEEFPREALKEMVRNIVMVEEGAQPSQDVVEALKAYHDTSVSEGTLADPYCVFRNAQGQIRVPLETGYMLCSNGFILNSLFCEWGYIVNLDADVLEVWVGWQNHPTPGNRYGQDKNDDGYFPCKLLLRVPLPVIACGAVTADGFVKTLVSMVEEDGNA